MIDVLYNKLAVIAAHMSATALAPCHPHLGPAMPETCKNKSAKI